MGAALSDIAFSVNSTVKDPNNFKPLNELIQDMVDEAIKKTLNSSVGTENSYVLDNLISSLNKKTYDRLVDQFHKPIVYPNRTDYNDIQIGNFFDTYLGKKLPDMIVQNDDGYLAGYNAYYRSIDLLRSYKMQDGTTEALFITSAGVVVYKLNEIMMVQSAAQESLRNGIIGNGKFQYIQDSFYDDETDTEYYLYPATTGSANKQFEICEFHPASGAYSKYTGTMPNNRTFMYLARQSSSSADAHMQRGANSGSFKKIANDMFLFCHGSTLALVKLVGTEAVVTSYWEAPIPRNTWSSEQSMPMIMYVNRHKQQVYVTFGGYGRRTDYTDITFAFLSYDINALTLTEISVRDIWAHYKVSATIKPIALNPKLIETDQTVWHIPVVYQSTDSNLPSTAMIIYYAINTDTYELYASLQTLPRPFHIYDTLCPVALSSTSVICAYRNSENQSYLWYSQYNAPLRIRAISAINTNDDLRLCVIDNMPMYFIGTPHYISSDKHYGGPGRCIYLLKAQAFKLGVVIDKDPSTWSVTVATSGVVDTTCYCPIYYSIGTRVGYFGEFKDHQSVELSNS